MAAKATQSFKSGRVEEAADLFSQALEILERNGEVTASSKHAPVRARRRSLAALSLSLRRQRSAAPLCLMRQTKKGILLNRSAVLLKLGQDEFAADDCSCVLELEPANPKALFRRARALANLGVLTPEMVLAAAEPPPEAPGARDARTMGRNEDFMGLDGDWGEAQEPRRDRLSTSVSSAHAPPRGEGGVRLGTSGLFPPGAPGGSTPTLISHSARCVSANLAELECGDHPLEALTGVSPTNTVHTPIASPPLHGDCESMVAKPFLSAAAAEVLVLTLSQVHL
eukprot:SAG11_NODE_2275_length_3585_cov_9.453528_3_plen_283_part_00